MRTDFTEMTAVQDAIGQSEAFLAFQERLSRVARVDRPVLIIGERGTGKELAARSIHYLSKRWQEPLVALNCAALAPSLMESELFGHEAGAFTGAVQRRRGRFEAADGGTLFLDELAHIPLEVQEKILRVVEYGGFERVGGSESVQADVRIVGATNADLPALAEQGAFMRDLLDRLSFEVIYVPPLRARGDDILLLARHFASRMAAEMGRGDAPEFSREAAARLEAHPWRGNVRELKNVVERAVYQAEGSLIQDLEFDPFRPPWQQAARETRRPESDTEERSEIAAWTPGDSFTDAVRRLEIGLLRRALAHARHNQRVAAKLLGLSYHQFRGVYRKHHEAL